MIKPITNQETYENLRRIIKSTGLDESSDTELVKKVLETELITNPIEYEIPFKVNSSDANVDGKEFTITSMKIGASDTLIGGKYFIHFYATDDLATHVYECKVGVGQQCISLHKATINEVPPDGIKTTFDNTWMQ